MTRGRLIIGFISLAALAIFLTWFGVEDTAPVDSGEPAGEQEARSANQSHREAPEPGAGSRTIWEPSDESDADGLPPLPGDVEGAELVQFNSSSLRAIQAGEIVEVPVPQLNGPVMVWIDSTDALASGNLSIKGHVNNSRLYSLVLTLGDTAMYATLGTPDGIFNIRGNNDHAWVIPARALEDHVDPDVPDFRVSEADPRPREPESEPIPAGSNQ